MRSIAFAVLLAGGLGLIGATTASAAPASGTAINDAAQVTSGHVVKVQHYWRRSRWWRHRHWYRCHYRHRSWGRCWW